jgi:ubiquinone/menaquinone biosynthesis C-methylase UbiE
MLKEKNPDEADNAVVLVGAGRESVYKELLSSYQDIIRVGLSQRGNVDVFCDLCSLPMRNDQVDLIFSSSVLEHVHDPEQAIREMYRVIKPGGYVYAEIPFMRAFHLAPVDYQRYTLPGLEALFSRYGFSLIEKGICSGPFTAIVLHVIDFWRSALSFNRYIQIAGLLFLRLLLHPLKYLDRLCESSSWAEFTACNFYYLGCKEKAKEKACETGY